MSVIPLSACICGATPKLIERIGAMSSDKYLLYKCDCGREGEVFWRDEKTALLTWNNTIKIARMRTDKV
jgi:lysyl-tRNA synthetase class I